MTYRPFAVTTSAAVLGVVVVACSTSPDDIVVAYRPPPGAEAPPFAPEPADAGGDAAPSGSDKILACVGTECQAPYDTCPTAFGGPGYKCAVNLLTDNANCGACGNVCPEFPLLSMRTRCVDGACKRECSDGAADCNGLVDDGCEVALLRDPANCGACGKACPAGVKCIDGSCGCPAGMTDCGSADCRNTSSDDDNCGACGHECPSTGDEPPPPPNMRYGCRDGECGRLLCMGSWADCNGDLADGCEVDLAADKDNCGACAKACASGQTCIASGMAPPACGCAPGETLCGTGSQAHCANLQTDPANCGVCDHPCGYINFLAPIGYENAPGSCKKGFCEYECNPGWGDCDGNTLNGCETNLQVNPANCGVCGNRCDVAAGQPCIGGACLMVECDAGTVTK